MIADPKPGKRIIEDALGWEQLRRAKLGPCRTCGETWLPTLHHLVPAGNGGDDIPNNLVPLCGHGSKGCHGLVEAWDIGARARLRETLSMEEVAYIVAKKSADYLEHAYPSAVTYCAATGHVERVTAGLCEGCGEPAEARPFASDADPEPEPYDLIGEGILNSWRAEE